MEHPVDRSAFGEGVGELGDRLQAVLQDALGHKAGELGFLHGHLDRGKVLRQGHEAAADELGQAVGEGRVVEVVERRDEEAARKTDVVKSVRPAHERAKRAGVFRHFVGAADLLHAGLKVFVPAAFVVVEELEHPLLRDLGRVLALPGLEAVEHVLALADKLQGLVARFGRADLFAQGVVGLTHLEDVVGHVGFAVE